ncbi:MAG: hypothetical protein U1E21_10870 [Reyranellaceae bacterium]|jgi:hypothetical protein
MPPMASDESDKEGKRFSPPGKQAALYIYRDFALGGSRLVAIGISGQFVGNLAASTWMRVDLEPAQYVVRCATKDSVDAVSIDLPAGQLQFVEVAMDAGRGCAVREVRTSQKYGAVITGSRVMAAAVQRPDPPPASQAIPESSRVVLDYRDSESNERRINLVIRYEAPMGRSRIVPFTIENLEQQTACRGTLVADSPRGGSFTLSCGFLEGIGSYEVAPGDRSDQFVARGRNPKGQPIVLIVGNPTGAPRPGARG